MLNKYPMWKNILILVVVILGLLYSVPNLYPDDEAIQVTTGSLSLNASDMEVITTALEAAQVDFFGEEVSEENILLRFADVDDQLRAKTAIEEALSDDYIIALNLAPTTPGWLQAIGAGKMNLGLDLQGGVHFLFRSSSWKWTWKRRSNDAWKITSAMCGPYYAKNAFEPAVLI